jgi:nucleotide sugar dehydrogenase
LVVRPLQRQGLVVGKDVFVAFSPERIDPGNRYSPQSTPRVVGGVTAQCTHHASQVLSPTAAGIHRVSSPEVAELTKLLENTFRAVNIALANEFSVVAGLFDVDIIEVIRAAATKPYGFMPFYPGPGVGGHCIPCDPHYLVWQLKARRVNSPVTEAAMAAIAARPRLVVARAEQLLAWVGRPLSDSRILIMGVAYKPAVADLRGSPALEIINELVRAGARVAYTDALIDRVCTASGVLTTEPRPAATEWDLVIVHTLHPSVDYSWLAEARIVLDATYQLEHLGHRHVP